jgi:hypothetical protein
MGHWALDLGTTNTGLARWDESSGQPQLVELPRICRKPRGDDRLEAPRLVPSVVELVSPASLLDRLGTWPPGDKPGKPNHAGGYRSWAELLARTFAVDVLSCPTCQGRMKLLALVKGPASISRTLATVGEATEVPQRSPGRGPPYWNSRVLRLKVLGDEDEGGGRGSGAGEEVA